MKKIISVFLAAVISTLFMSAAAFAAAKSVPALKPISTERYTGNMGDSFIDNLGTRNGCTATNGKTYKSGLEVWLARWNYQAEESWVKATYNINAKYDKLSGQIVIIDNSPNTTNFDISVEIRGDGKLLKKYNILPDTKTKSVNVSVSGVKKLEIYAYDNKAVCAGTSLGLVNFKLSTDDSKALITNVTEAKMNKGMTLTISTDAAKKETIEWKSNKTSVASVSKDGMITAKKAGTATISLVSSTGRTAYIKITVV